MDSHVFAHILQGSIPAVGNCIVTLKNPQMRITCAKILRKHYVDYRIEAETL